MAQQYSAEWARNVIEDGVKKAQGLIDDPAQIDGLLAQLQDKLQGVPKSLRGAFENVPLMAQMVKSYVTREYTEVSPKVVVSLVSAFLYLVKKDDLISDDIPILGLVDDLAVAAVAMIINEPELEAFKLWREKNGLQKAAQPQGADMPQADVVAVEPIEVAPVEGEVESR